MNPAAPSNGSEPDLRPFMAGFPTGVSIVTTVDTEKRPHGMTCTSLCSASLNPPTVLVCLRANSPTLRALTVSGVFSINVLGQHAESTAALFASGDPERFDRVCWRWAADGGGPHLLRAARAIADCRVGGTRSSGDHAVVFGEVAMITAISEAAPLLYGLRRFAVWPHG